MVEAPIPIEKIKGMRLLGQVTRAAQGGDWEGVDALLPEAVKHDVVLKWAGEGLSNSDPNMRDLACSIFGTSKKPLDEDIRTRLLNIVVNDTQEAPRFRAAVALADHKRAGEEVKKAFSELVLSSDGDISINARKYLERL